MRIADDGEILLRGPNVFGGYWHNQDATDEVFADGWFRTGDLGCLDDDGYLSVTGRKKELIVTAGGKNVAPAVLEDRLRAHPLVGQCMVVGDQQPFVGALVTVDEEAWPGWLAAARAPGGHGRRRRCGTTRRCGPPSRRRSTTPTRRCPGPSRSGSSGSCRPTSPWPAASSPRR